MAQDVIDQPERAWWRRAAKAALVIAAALALLFGGLLVAASFYLTGERVRLLAVEALNEGMLGSFEIDSLKLSLLEGTVEAHGVKVRDPFGDTVLFADSIRAVVCIRSLLRNEMRLSELLVGDSRILLLPPPDTSDYPDPSTFTLEDAFRPRSPTDPDESSDDEWSVLVERLRIEKFDLQMKTADGLDIDISNGRVMSGSLGSGPSGVELTLSSFFDELRVVLDDLELDLASVSIEGLSLSMGAGDDGRIGLGQIRATYAHGTSPPEGNMQLSGAVLGLGFEMDPDELGLAIEILGVVDLEADAIRAFLPEDSVQHISPAGHLSFELEVQGTTSAPRVSGSFATEGLVLLGEGFSALTGHILMESDVVDLTSLSVSFLEGRVDGRLRLDLSDDLEPDWLIEATLTDLAVGRFANAWNTALEGEEATSDSLPEKISGKLVASGRGLDPPRGHATFDLYTAGLPADLLPGLPGTLRLRGSVRFDERSLRVEPVRITGGGLDVTASGLVPIDERPAMDLSLRIVHTRPSKLFAALEVPLGARDLNLVATVTGRLEDPRVKGTLWLNEARLEDLPSFGLQAPFRFVDGLIHLEDARATIARGEILARGFVGVLAPDLSPLDDPRIELEVRGHQLDIASFVDGALEGRASFAASLAGTLSRPMGQATIDMEKVSLDGIDIDVVTGLFALDGEWVEAKSFELVLKAGGRLEGSGRLHMTDSRLEASLKASQLPLSLVAVLTEEELGLGGKLDAEIEIAGSVEEPSFKGSLGIEGFVLDDLNLGTLTTDLFGTLDRFDLAAKLVHEAGELSMNGWVAPHDETLMLEVAGQSLRVEKMPFLDELEQTISGMASVDLRVGGALAAPGLEGSVLIHSIELEGERLGNGTVDLTIREVGGGVHSVAMDLLGASKWDAEISLDPALAITGMGKMEELSLAWLVPSFAEHDLDAVLTGDISVVYETSPEKMDIRVDLDALEVKMADEVLISQRPLSLKWDGVSLRLEDLMLVGPNGTFEAHGEIGETLELFARGTLEMELLSPFISDIALASGSLQMDIAVTGTAEEPIATGQIGIARALRLRPRRMIREIEISTGRARLEQDRFVLEQLTGQVHGGMFRAHGEVELEALQPQGYRLYFSGQSLPLRTQELLLEANADLSLIGAGSSSKLSGRVEIVRGRYMEKFELDRFVFRPTRRVAAEEPLAERVPMLADIDLDLRVTSLGAMEIRADAGAFALDMVLDADLRVTGTAADPILDGRVEASRGGLTFPRARLDIARSNIEFVPRPGEAIRPRIDLRAEGEVSPASTGEQGQTTYFVTLMLDGDLEEMVLDLTSDPALDRLEILSVLVTGRRPADHMGGAAGTQADAAMVFAGSQLAEPLTRFVTQQLESHLNLELELSAEVSTSGLLLVAGKEVTRRLRFEWAFQQGFSGDAPASSAARARYLLSDRIFLEGTTEAAVGQGVSSFGSRDGARSRLELKLRIYGT